MSRKLTSILAAGASALALTAAAGAQTPDKIHVPGRILLPESITSSADGSVFVGSISEGAVYRAAPGAAEAEVFIPSHEGGLAGAFGVFADDASGTLFVCSGNLSFGPPQPNAAPPAPSALKAFDLKTGALKASYELPLPNASCNDSAVGADGSVYATDTPNMRIVRLAPGAKELELWSPEGAFGPAGQVLDGVAVIGNRVYVNTLQTSKLFAVDIGADGKAGKVTEIALDKPLERPDGMRSYGKGLLVAQGAGKLSKVVLDGDKGANTTLLEGKTGGVGITPVGDTGYFLEGQFASMQAGPDAQIPPIEAVAVKIGPKP